MDGDKPTGLSVRRCKDGTEPTSVYADDAVIYDYAEGEEVEHVCEIGPDMRRPVLAYAFSIETIGLPRTTDNKANQISLRHGDPERAIRKRTWVTALDSWFPLINCIRSG